MLAFKLSWGRQTFGIGEYNRNLEIIFVGAIIEFAFMLTSW